jgi:hypothetical protein
MLIRKIFAPASQMYGRLGDQAAHKRRDGAATHIVSFQSESIVLLDDRPKVRNVPAIY